MTKLCNVCNAQKPFDAFSPNKYGKHGLRPECKACRKTPEARAKAREGELRRRYAMLPEGYDAMLASQGGHCALCNYTPGTNGLRLSVDHDHATGRVRGLLCGYCNRALGRFGDTAEEWAKVMAYLVGP